MRRVAFDTQFFPVVVQRIAGDHTNEEHAAELEGIAERLRGFRREGARVVTIVDLSGAGNASPVQRKLQAAWVSQHEALLLETTVATAFVAPSRLVAGALTAIFWLKPPPGRHAVFSVMGEAVDWISKEAARDGLAVPGGLRDALVSSRPSAA